MVFGEERKCYKCQVALSLYWDISTVLLSTKDLRYNNLYEERIESHGPEEQV